MRYRFEIGLGLYLGAALVILLLSLHPSPPVPDWGVLSWDKAQHALAYAVLTGLGGWALTPVCGWRRAFAYALVLSALYGLLLEGAQALLTRNRVAQMTDEAANVAGAAAVYALARLLGRGRGS